MVALKTGEIEAFVARPDPSRSVVLVFGPDAGLVSERVDAIVRASVDDPADIKRANQRRSLQEPRPFPD